MKFQVAIDITAEPKCAETGSAYYSSADLIQDELTAAISKILSKRRIHIDGATGITIVSVF